MVYIHGIFYNENKQLLFNSHILKVHDTILNIFIVLWVSNFNYHAVSLLLKHGIKEVGTFSKNKGG